MDPPRGSKWSILKMGGGRRFEISSALGDGGNGRMARSQMPTRSLACRLSHAPPQQAAAKSTEPSRKLPSLSSNVIASEQCPSKLSDHIRRGKDWVSWTIANRQQPAPVKQYLQRVPRCPDSRWQLHIAGSVLSPDSSNNRKRKTIPSNRY